MQAQQPPMIFTEAERQAGDRLLKLALETDRVEGYTEPHAVMIARLSETIGQSLGLHGIDLSALKFAALAHDIGERGMRRNYLLSPNALAWEERLDLWRHPILGEQAASEMKLSRQTQLLIRWHHEWWNGQGYPDGLSGEAIPLGARILRVVDTYYSLIAARPYRQAYDLVEAEQVIADLAGIEFDPQVARLLLALVAEERRQREAELELQHQQQAFWNPAPQFGGQFEDLLSDDTEQELTPVAQTASELSEVSEETAAVAPEATIEPIEPASAYESALSFAEAQSAEPAAAPAELPAEAPVPTISLDQAPTLEFPTVELPAIQPTAAELAETREPGEPIKETQN
ncbi:MAG: HD-GYP domain-containing protein [Blastocatellia bacterium]